jgi:hypothetical protein
VATSSRSCQCSHWQPPFRFKVAAHCQCWQWTRRTCPSESRSHVLVSPGPVHPSKLISGLVRHNFERRRSQATITTGVRVTSTCLRRLLRLGVVPAQQTAPTGGRDVRVAVTSALSSTVTVTMRSSITSSPLSASSSSKSSSPFTSPPFSASDSNSAMHAVRMLGSRASLGNHDRDS